MHIAVVRPMLLKARCKVTWETVSNSWKHLRLYMSSFSVKRGVLHNIPLESGMPKKLVRLIKICLNETYSKIRVGKLLSDTFPVQNGLK